MANYNDLFDSQNIPTEQNTGFTPPISESSIKVPEMPKLDESSSKTEPFQFSGKHIIVIVLCIIVLYFVVEGVPEINTTNNTDFSYKIENTENYNSSKGSTLNIDNPTNKGEALFWVNYYKELRVSDFNVVQYTIVCSSSQLGSFEFNVTHSQFVQLPESGIIPVVTTQLSYKDSKETYYTAFRLHDNWKNLLDGNLN